MEGAGTEEVSENIETSHIIFKPLKNSGTVPRLLSLFSSPLWIVEASLHNVGEISYYDYVLNGWPAFYSLGPGHSLLGLHSLYNTVI